MNPYQARELGVVYRAAIGLSEETDAMIIVVSEETGEISRTERRSHYRSGWTGVKETIIRKHAFIGKYPGAEVI